jgi:GAF domain-containing protein
MALTVPARRADTSEVATASTSLGALVADARRASRGSLAALLVHHAGRTLVVACDGEAGAEIPVAPLAPLTDVVTPSLLARALPLILPDGPMVLRRLGLDTSDARFCLLVPVVVDGFVVGALLAACPQPAPDPEALPALVELAAEASALLA